MAARLINVLRFSSIAAGQSSSQAHDLTDSLGNALTPDFLFPNSHPTANITVTATSTNVTVVNNGGSAATVDVWCEYRYPMARAIGSDTNLTPQPFVVGNSPGTTPTLTTGTFIYVNGATGNDSTATGASALPFLTIQAALNRLYQVSPVLTVHRCIFVTGASVFTEQLIIPDFQSALTATFDTTNTIPGLYLMEALTIYADLEYGTQTSVTASAWESETDGSSGMQQVVVTGVTAIADELRSRMLLGTGALQACWIGRNDATSGGSTRLYVSTDSEITGPLRLATPIELRGPADASGETIKAQNLRCSVAIGGFRITSQNGSRSIGMREVQGEFWVGACDVHRGFALRNVGVNEFYQCRLSSGAGAGNSASATYSTYVESGAGVSYDYCLFDVNSFMDINTDSAYFGCYMRGCNDMGHGGGAYLTGGMFDFYGCYVDQITGQGTSSVWNYSGGPACSIEACTVRPGTGGTGINCREFGGLRVKNVKGSVATYGMRIGQMASPYLGGSGTVRIDTLTTITGLTGDLFIGTQATTYAALRALPSGARRLTDPARFATIWENS